jgi:hypothetical protein
MGGKGKEWGSMGFLKQKREGQYRAGLSRRTWKLRRR